MSKTKFFTPTSLSVTENSWITQQRQELSSFPSCPSAVKLIPKVCSLWVNQPEQEMWSFACLQLYAFMVCLVTV
jgi:hypothetical protein